MNSLLDAKDLELIHRLELSARRRLAGQATGEQRSPALGGGIEFADYREYMPGDDVRQVDWSVFLRFRKLLVKLCAEEKELTLMLLIDTSLSMAWGQASKYRQAQKIAAILGGIALGSGNRAGVLSWGNDLGEVVTPQRGARSLSLLVERIRRLEPQSQNRPVECARQFATRWSRRCLAVLLTDLLYPEWSAVLTGLKASGCETHVLQILAPEELSPPERGELTLVDLENGSEAPLHLDTPLLELYEQQTKLWLGEVEAECRGAGLGYTFVRSDSPLPRTFLQDLKRSGLVC